MNTNLKILILLLCNSFLFNTSLEAQCPHLNLNSQIVEDSSIDEIRAELYEMEIPVFSFYFENSEFPSYDVLLPPAGCIGTAITNCDYVKGKLIVTIKGDTIYDSGEYIDKETGVRVKYRGNSSTASQGQIKKSYKLKLSKKEDLLFRGDKALKDKDWVLLGLGARHLNQVAANETARLCGMPWQATGRHVCVIMNDKYIGSYYLSEAVKASSNRVNIKDTGFLIENDAYWWKPDEVYFKSDSIPNYMGWTFKEPDPDEIDEETIEGIREVINTFETSLYQHENISEMCDLESFANWLLAHDILGTIDAMGSNMFVVKESMDDDKPFDSKLKMGPLWDFDNCFTSPDSVHAVIYWANGFWFNKLTQYPEFKQIYYERWCEVKDEIIQPLMAHLKNYIDCNPDLHKVRLIDYRRGLLSKSLIECPYDDYISMESWYKNRLTALDNIFLREWEDPDTSIGVDSLNKDDSEDKEETDDTGIESIGAEVIVKGLYNLQGQPVNSDYKGIIIKVLSNGKVRKEIAR